MGPRPHPLAASTGGRACCPLAARAPTPLKFYTSCSGAGRGAYSLCSPPCKMAVAALSLYENAGRASRKTESTQLTFLPPRMPHRPPYRLNHFRILTCLKAWALRCIVFAKLKLQAPETQWPPDYSLLGRKDVAAGLTHSTLFL